MRKSKRNRGSTTVGQRGGVRFIPDGSTIATPQRRIAKRRRFRFARVVALVVALLGASSIIVFNVDAFKIKIVEVTGVKRANAEQVYEESRVSIGENMIVLPIASIRESIERQPLIKHASVRRIVPSMVRVRVYEREPFAYVTNGRQYYLVDNDLIVLEKASGIADPRLPCVHSDAIRHADVGGKLSFPNHEVMLSMYGIDGESLKKRYGMVRFDRRGIKVFTRDGTYVLMGDGSDIEKKMMLSPIIIKRLRKAGEKFEGINFELLSVPSFIPKK